MQVYGNNRAIIAVHYVDVQASGIADVEESTQPIRPII